MSNLGYKQVANVTRRTWDVEAYEKRAKERTKAAEQQGSGSGGSRQNRKNNDDGGTPSSVAVSMQAGEGESTTKPEFVPAAKGAAGPHLSERAFLKARRGKVDVDSKIGSVEMINPEAVATTSSTENSSIAGVGGVGTGSIKDGVTKSGVGWHCKVCDCFLKDSHTYLDHINGRKHQRNLGYSMRVERSTKDQVVSRLDRLAKEKEASKSGKSKFGISAMEATDFEDTVREKDEEARRRKEERAKKRKERKKKLRSEEQLQQSEEGGKDTAVDEDGNNGDDDDDDVEEGGIDPSMAALMGFSGFGGGKKNS